MVIYLYFAISVVIMTGGLKAVIYTDTLQTVIMVAGAIVLMIISKLSDFHALSVLEKPPALLYSALFSNH